MMTVSVCFHKHAQCKMPLTEKREKERRGSGANFLQEIAKRDPPKTHLAYRATCQPTGRRTNAAAAAGFFVLYRYRGRESQRSPEGG